MIVVTGAAGFIGSNVVGTLNDNGYTDIVLVDDFSNDNKERNYRDLTFSQLVQRESFFDWLGQNHLFVQIILHLGARTDTAEFDWDVFVQMNLEYSKKIWKYAVEFGLPVIYASSAATYGNGELGFEDDEAVIPSLKPLNPYGRSKNDFDKWVLQQLRKPFFWAGLKFFNVYGPNEYHKGRMASVVYHTYTQIKKSGKMKLFRSHHPDFKDGEQLRDFIYVKDVADVILFLMENRTASGIFNLGTGNASTFIELAHYTFEAMDRNPEIEFIDIPEDIREKYQYFTEAKMMKLRSAGYDHDFTSLKEGVTDYVRNYLINNDIND